MRLRRSAQTRMDTRGKRLRQPSGRTVAAPGECFVPSSLRPFVRYDLVGASEPIPCGVFIVVQVPVGTFL